MDMALVRQWKIVRKQERATLQKVIRSKWQFSEVEKYIHRTRHMVADNLLWCGPCFAATIHVIRKLTKQNVATCIKCKAQSVRVDGINVKQIGW